MARRATAERTDDVAASDLRWLAFAGLTFAAALVLFFVALAVYHAFGGHPGVWMVIRALRRAARWLIPRWSHHWLAK